MTKNTDPLDLAYVAIGAVTAWNSLNGAMRFALGGQLEYISKCVDPRILDYLQETWDEVKNEYGGVWVYEVCEPFGERYGAAIIAGEDVDFKALIIELAQAGL